MDGAESSNKDGRLRAACERCHNLKNRCVRSGGTDSRCERCHRLDIDCVYSTSSRIGRPKTRKLQQVSRDKSVHKSLGDGELQSPKVASNYQAEQITSGMMTTPISLNEGPMVVDGIYTPKSYSTSSGSIEPTVSPKGFQMVGIEWNLGQEQSVEDIINVPFCQTAALNTLEHDALLFPPNSRDRYLGNMFKSTDHMTDGLVHVNLQYQLYRLSSKLEKSPIEDCVEESLDLTKRFLELLQTGLNASGLAIDPNMSAASTGMKDNACGDRTSPASTKRNEVDIDFLTVLQVSTNYTLILHMLDKVVDAVSNMSGGSAAFSLGLFSLASQTALNRDVVLYIVGRMTQQLRVLIGTLRSNCQDVSHPTSSDTGQPPDATRPIDSFNAIAKLMSEREEYLVRKLSNQTKRH